MSNEKLSNEAENPALNKGAVSDLLPLDLHDRINLAFQMEQWENSRGKIHSVNQLEEMLSDINMAIAKKQ
jgi:hypothetical protein